MKRSVGVLVVAVGFVLACGGGGDASVVSPEPAAAPGYGSVAYQTWEADGMFYKFNSESRVTAWWRSMPCSTVEGTYTQEGEVIKIKSVDTESCMKWEEVEMKQLSECAIAMHWRKDPVLNEIVDDDVWMFERKEPKCP